MSEDWGFDELEIVGGTPQPWHRGAARVTPGSKLGTRFDVLERLGEGAASLVFRAKDLSTGRLVALKLLRQAQLDPEGRERFRREAETTASLTHPGIVRLEAAGEVEQLPFIAYELVEGARQLSEVMAELPLARRVEIVRQVAEALGHAHGHGVVHRDVKPRNVLVDGEGRPRLIDFGLAAAAGYARLTQTQALVGTATHMAPEQIRSKHQDVGPPTDVWAVGVVLYECLTGQLPFQGRTLPDQTRLVCTEQPVSPRSLEPGVAAELEAVCLRCLEKDRSLRYATGAELAAALP